MARKITQIIAEHRGGFIQREMFGPKAAGENLPAESIRTGSGLLVAVGTK